MEETTTKPEDVLTPEVMPQESALATIIKAEIDMQIATAKAFPRSLKIFMDKVLSMSTVTQTVAESCTYALPRGGKTLKGPSVRLAEIVGSSYGNIRYGARVIFNDGKHVTAQGICHDLESNTFASVEVKRSIMQNEYKWNEATRKNERTGKMIQMTEDMQVVTGNAACSIAMRNAIFKVVPAALIQDAYEKIQEVARGTAETLVARRDKAIKFFTDKGIKKEQIAEEKGLLDQYGKMCDTCAFKWEQEHRLPYFLAADQAAFALMSEGQFNCHTHDFRCADKPCAGFLLAKLVFEK